MGYDRFWVERNGHPKRFLERRQADEMGQLKEFDALCNRLYKQGHFVVLSAGKNFLFDEQFLFEDASNARAFYESGYSAFESFLGDDDEGYGFQEVSLYRAGRLVGTKESAPTRWSERKGTECQSASSRAPSTQAEKKETEYQSACTGTCFCISCRGDNLDSPDSVWEE